MVLKDPMHPDEVTPQWLTHALRSGGVIKEASVLSVVRTILGADKGFLSSIVRAEIEYDKKEPGAPLSVVVKLETESEEYRKFNEELSAFQREIRFYREVAPLVPVRLPRFYYGVDKPPAYSLVMEDLSSYTPGDQIEGMHPGQVKDTVRMMAKIQAAFWDNEALAKLDWMPLSNNMAEDYLEKWDSFVEHFGAICDPRGLELGAKLRDYLDWKWQKVQTRPRTIVHFDLREDNLLFGNKDSDEDIIILDWQLAMRNIGAFDIARLIAGSEIPAEREGHEFQVLRVWYDTLIENGVSGYSWDDAVYDFRLSALNFMCNPVHFHSGVINLTGRIRKVVEVIFTRLYSFVVEIDAGSILPR